MSPVLVMNTIIIFISINTLIKPLWSVDINCTETDECRDTEINCPLNDDCNILCDGLYSCYGSNIICPLNGDCNIKCSWEESCRNSVINATYSNGNFNLICDSKIHADDQVYKNDVCQNIKVHGSESQTNTGNIFDIHCDKNYRSCKFAEIHCAKATDCNITCDGIESCRQTNIHGPTDYELTVNCNGAESCRTSGIHGKEASNLDIIGCNADISCDAMDIYCPTNTAGQSNCYFEGSKFGTGNVYIYAEYGWQDLDINVPSSRDFSTDPISATIYCGNTSNENCVVASDEWRCDDPGSFCANIPTIQPTPSPTTTTTTTESPTNVPSVSPTMQPSISPSPIPTASPTQQPSPFPTNTPSHVPTTPNPTRAPSRDSTRQTTTPTQSESPTLQPITTLSPSSTSSPTATTREKQETTSTSSSSTKTPADTAITANQDTSNVETLLIIVIIVGICLIFVCLLALFCWLKKGKQKSTTTIMRKPPTLNAVGTISNSSYIKNMRKHPSGGLSSELMIGGEYEKIQHFSPVPETPNSQLNGKGSRKSSNNPSPIPQNSAMSQQSSHLSNASHDDHMILTNSMNVTAGGPLHGAKDSLVDIHDLQMQSIDEELMNRMNHKRFINSLAPSEIEQVQHANEDEVIDSDDDIDHKKHNKNKFGKRYKGALTPKGYDDINQNQYDDDIDAAMLQFSDNIKKNNKNNDQREVELEEMVLTPQDLDEDHDDLNYKNVNREKKPLNMEKRQSEGGEQYHKQVSMGLVDRVSVTSAVSNENGSKKNIFNVKNNNDALNDALNEEAEEDDGIIDDIDIMTPNGNELDNIQLNYDKVNINNVKHDASPNSAMDSPTMESPVVGTYTPSGDVERNVNDLKLRIIPKESIDEKNINKIYEDEEVYGDDELENMILTPQDQEENEHKKEEMKYDMIGNVDDIEINDIHNNLSDDDDDVIKEMDTPHMTPQLAAMNNNSEEPLMMDLKL